MRRIVTIKLKICTAALLLFLVSSTTWAKEYKCYVTGYNTMHYLVIVDFDSPGMAARAARHVWIKTPDFGKVGVQDVIECRSIDKPFQNKAARAQEELTPLNTITSSRKK